MTPTVPATLAPRVTPQTHTCTDRIRWMPARALLSPSRLDIVVKYLYFRSLEGDRPDADTETLYDQHIVRRTGGLEDDKRSPADYRQASRTLLASLRDRGFDPAHAVPIGTNGLPWNGAHRIAACMALDLPVAVRDTPGAAPTWDFEWFRERGFAQPSLDRIVRSYARLSSRVAAFVFWGPSLAHWPAMAAHLGEHADVVGWRDLRFEPDDMRAFVRDLYAWRLGPLPNERIEAKARSLAAGHLTARVWLTDAGLAPGRADIESWTTDLKGELRAIAGRDRHDYFSTAHATDSLDEARYVADLAFNDNSLRQLAARRGREDRPLFLEWLGRYRDTLLKRGLALDDACIVGSAVLEAVGVRQATDIDCVITTAVRTTRFHEGVVALDDDVDLVTAGYHRRFEPGPVVSDSDLVADPAHHFLFRGLKFANPELVIDRKRQHGRPKDLADVALWTERHTLQSETRTHQCVVVWPATLSHAEAAILRCDVVRVGSADGPSPLTHQVTMPPSVDDLPECLLTDPDPIATLERVGVDIRDLHAAEVAAAGGPAHAGHAFRRLRGFSWMARWLEGWLTPLRPDAILIAPTDTSSTALVAAAVARSLAISVTGSAADLPAAFEHAAQRSIGDPPAPRSDAATVCRHANESTMLLQLALASSDASERARTADAQLVGLTQWRVALEDELAEARTALTLLGAVARGRAIWLWGAGSAGRAAMTWLHTHGVPIAGVVDSDVAKHGSPCGDLAISAPGVLAESIHTARRPLVVVASVHADAIGHALATAGIAAGDQVRIPVSVALRNSGA